VATVITDKMSSIKTRLNKIRHISDLLLYDTFKHLISQHFINSNDVGNVWETFAFNQLSYNHDVLFSEQSDFFIDKTYTFEIGGKNKKRKQIKDVPDSYILADDIEFGTERRIPLWLLGFLY